MTETLVPPSLFPPGVGPGFSCAHYPLREHLYDEMTDGGPPRPHWASLVAALSALGLPELLRRWEDAQEFIHENGVTYNVYGDPRGMDRPWHLDPVPLLIPPADAHRIEAGLVQRARLLEAILADVYGPQLVLREGILPPELVYPNPNFLRPCLGIPLPSNQFLHLYAANLGRGPDGGWWVLGDRTQAPSGAGYALENRLVVARMLPGAFRDCRAQRLALFFQALRDALRGISPQNKDNPRVVLLTPGPYNETYFEHAYLARYLGYTLVEGGDLTVRDNRVFLRVLGGLQPVDVIFRRLDDDYCDPLELRPDSFLGVPGLVQAVRAGGVAVANALGSGLVETPGFLPYLPTLCRRLLSEDLKLPSAPTWWCGDPASLEHVLHHLPNMVIKPALPGDRMEPIFGDRLTLAEQEEVAGRLRARPQAFIGQGQVPISTTPVLLGDRLEPRQMVLRTYLTASSGSFTLMPGGLTRVTASPDTTVVSMQQGGGSKDTWFLSSGPVSAFSLLPLAEAPVVLTRGGSDLPSRAADNLYWLGRYAERAAGAARLLRGTVMRLTEKAGVAESPELPVLLRAVALQCDAVGFNNGHDSPQGAEAELRCVVFDRQRPGSLASTLDTLHRIAGVVRDRISIDMWRVLSNVGREEGTRDGRPGSRPVGPKPPSAALADVLDHLNRIVLTLAAFDGLIQESMTRGQGWSFLNMGRRLERSLRIIALLRDTLCTTFANEFPLLEAVLEIADSAMTYRRRYLSRLQTTAVLDLLLADETNPRSLAFQLGALAEDVDRLPREETSAGLSAEQRLMLGALTQLRLADCHQLAQEDSRGTRPQLRELLERLAIDLPALSDAMTQHYLSHLQPSRHYAAPTPGVVLARLL